MFRERDIFQHADIDWHERQSIGLPISAHDNYFDLGETKLQLKWRTSSGFRPNETTHGDA